MEKTMRWWSDCTANWREKWCEVRDERNKAKKDTKVLKSKLETAVKDLSTHKQEFQNLERQNAQLKKELVKFQSIIMNHPDQFDKKIISDLDFQLKNSLDADEMCNNTDKSENLMLLSLKEDSKNSSKDGSINDQSNLEKDLSQGAVPKHSSDLSKDTSPLLQEKRYSKVDPVDEEALMQKMSVLTLKLEEATKTINSERE